MNEETGVEEETHVEYPFRQQSSGELSLTMGTASGKCEITDLSFEKTEEFEEGCYVVTVTDVIQSQKPLPAIKIAIIICP